MVDMDNIPRVETSAIHYTQSTDTYLEERQELITRPGRTKGERNGA